ncbi:uncharacterized protein LOC113147278 [Cyclospora cayetanensis]|uniref:Uncharacterized protein LOC113147278 n=1 Tax=Cyclospora cayetanensis TaxID=88456 RepID=A0A6P6RZY6_9EIME|nr:uncharacterized protein LOC113147278 [Cyclospora cayetanensis]
MATSGTAAALSAVRIAAAAPASANRGFFFAAWLPMRNLSSLTSCSAGAKRTQAIGVATCLGAPGAPCPMGPLAPWGPLRASRRFAARTRIIREEQRQRRQQQQQQPAPYADPSLQHSDPHHPCQYQHQHQQQQPTLGTQLLYAVASGAGVFLGFTLLARLFGWGPRTKAVHVDAYGRPVDPVTGAPL